MLTTDDAIERAEMASQEGTEYESGENEYKCKNCRYESLSIFEFPCDACYFGSWYEEAEGSEDE